MMNSTAASTAVPTATAGASSRIQIRVLAASTGVCYPITLSQHELTVANIRRHLAAAVPQHDQILLLGPPYKVPKDSTLQSEEILTALRLGDLEDDPTSFHPESGSNTGGAGGDGVGSIQPPLSSTNMNIASTSATASTTEASIQSSAQTSTSVSASTSTSTSKSESNSESQSISTSIPNNDTNDTNDTNESTQTKPTQNKNINTNTRRRKCVLTTTEKTGARRLFLFSKQALSEAAPEPLPCSLGPIDLSLPTQPDPSPIVLNQDSESTSSIAISPLHQALQVYERRFMLHLCQGRTYADGADMRLASCRTCVAEQAVMARALRAAVSNLADHRNGAARTRTEFTATFQAKTAFHTQVLSTFENVLASLAQIPLHPTLVAIARANGRMMETLLDTVPVERERAWSNQCQTSHQRLLTLFQDLNASFAELGTLASREEEARQDLEAEEEVKTLSDQVENTMLDIREEQAERLVKLTSDHKEVVNIVLNAISDGEKAQAAFTTLEEMTKASNAVLPSMEKDDAILKEILVKVGQAKTNAMKRMKQRLRQVSIAQSKIQRVITSVGVLRDALNQQCDNMSHLEHVVELPNAYRDFLSEICRRRAYGDAVTATSNVMIERLAAMRTDEIKAREKFLRGPGRHLMPSFFEVFVPTLATLPPLFTPQLPAMVEMDTLPVVGPHDIEDRGQGREEGTVQFRKRSTSDEMPGASDESSLTVSVSNNPGEKGEVTGSSSEKQTMTKDKLGVKEVTNEVESLIVSADEASGQDVIMESGNNEEETAEAEAERKTLAYENAVLRQALERLGGQSPQTYIEDAKKRDEEQNLSRCSKDVAALEAKNEGLQNQLDLASKKLEQTNAALEEVKKGPDGKLCDKISHSSFNVGDVVLFMPTGRKHAGKRTYMAFHSGCPYRFLSTDSIEGSPDYVLGRIVYQEELIAGAVGTDENPHGLHVGTKFWILTVERFS